MNAADLAARLLAVRDGAPPLERLTPESAPAAVPQAYAVADLVVAALSPRFGAVTGYKVGATSVEGQKFLGLDEPFYGRVLAQWRVESGAVWIPPPRAASVEPEVGFVLAADLPPRQLVYSAAEVRCAIGRAIPVLEINAPAFARPFEVGGRALIADNGVTQALVSGGPGLPIDAIPDLAGETVNMSKNGNVTVEGCARAVLGDPLRALLWLANALRLADRGLRAGDLVASGAMSQHVALLPGDFIVARYATLGTVTLRIGPV